MDELSIAFLEANGYQYYNGAILDGGGNYLSTLELKGQTLTSEADEASFKNTKRLEERNQKNRDVIKQFQDYEKSGVDNNLSEKAKQFYPMYAAEQREEGIPAYDTVDEFIKYEEEKTSIDADDTFVTTARGLQQAGYEGIDDKYIEEYKENEKNIKEIEKTNPSYRGLLNMVTDSIDKEIENKAWYDPAFLDGLIWKGIYGLGKLLLDPSAGMKGDTYKEYSEARDGYDNALKKRKELLKPLVNIQTGILEKQQKDFEDIYEKLSLSEKMDPSDKDNRLVEYAIGELKKETTRLKSSLDGDWIYNPFNVDFGGDLITLGVGDAYDMYAYNSYLNNKITKGEELTEKEELVANTLASIHKGKGLKVEHPSGYGLTEGTLESAKFLIGGGPGRLALKGGTKALTRGLSKGIAKSLAASGKMSSRTAVKVGNYSGTALGESANMFGQAILHPNSTIGALNKYHGEILFDTDEKGKTTLTTDRRTYDTIIKESEIESEKIMQQLALESDPEKSQKLHAQLKKIDNYVISIKKPSTILNAVGYGLSEVAKENIIENYGGRAVSKAFNNSLTKKALNKPWIRSVKNSAAVKKINQLDNVFAGTKKKYNDLLGAKGTKLIGGNFEEMAEEVVTQLVPVWGETDKEAVQRRGQLLEASFYGQVAGQTLLMGGLMKAVYSPLTGYNAYVKSQDLKDKRKGFQDMVATFKKEGVSEEDVERVLMSMGEGNLSVQAYNNQIHQLREEKKFNQANNIERNKYYNIGKSLVSVGKGKEFVREMETLLFNGQIPKNSVLTVQESIKEVKNLEKEMSEFEGLRNRDYILQLKSKLRYNKNLKSQIEKEKSRVESEEKSDDRDAKILLNENHLQDNKNLEIRLEKALAIETSPQMVKKLQQEAEVTTDIVKEFDKIKNNTGYTETAKRVAIEKVKEKFGTTVRNSVYASSIKNLENYALKGILNEKLTQLEKTFKKSTKSEEEIKKDFEESESLRGFTESADAVKKSIEEVETKETPISIEELGFEIPTPKIEEKSTTELISEIQNKLSNLEDFTSLLDKLNIKYTVVEDSLKLDTTRKEVKILIKELGIDINKEPVESSETVEEDVPKTKKEDLTDSDFWDEMLPQEDGSFENKPFNQMVESTKSHVKKMTERDGVKPTFEEYIEDVKRMFKISHENFAPHFKSFGLAWGAAKLGESNWRDVYDKHYLDIKGYKEKLEESYGFNEITETPELVEEEVLIQQKEEAEVVNVKSTTTPIKFIPGSGKPVYVTPNQGKTFGTDYTLGYSAIEHENTFEVVDGKKIYRKVSAAVPRLKENSSVSFKDLVNPNKNNIGDKLKPVVADLTAPIVVNRDEFGIAIGDPISFSQWVDENKPDTMTLEEYQQTDAYIGKIPMMYEDTDGNKLTYIHEVDWYGLSSVGDRDKEVGEVDFNAPSPGLLKDIQDNKDQILELRKQILSGQVEEVEIIDNLGMFPLQIIAKEDGEGNVIPTKKLNEVSPDSKVVWMKASGSLIGLDGVAIDSKNIINMGDNDKGFLKAQEKMVSGVPIKSPINGDKTHYMVHIATVDGVKKYFILNAKRTDENNKNEANKQDVTTARIVAAASNILKYDKSPSGRNKAFSEAHPYSMTYEEAVEIQKQIEEINRLDIKKNGGELVESLVAHYPQATKIKRTFFSKFGNDLLFFNKETGQFATPDSDFTQNTKYDKNFEMSKRPAVSVEKIDGKYVVSKIKITPKIVNGETITEADNYEDFLKERLSTNVMGYNVGTELEPVHTIAVQQPVKIRPIVKEIESPEKKFKESVEKLRKEPEVQEKIAEVEKTPLENNPTIDIDSIFEGKITTGSGDSFSLAEAAKEAGKLQWLSFSPKSPVQGDTVSEKTNLLEEGVEKLTKAKSIKEVNEIIKNQKLSQEEVDAYEKHQKEFNINSQIDKIFNLESAQETSKQSDSEVADIEKRRQEELDNIGQKALQRRLKDLKEATTDKQTAQAIIDVEKNTKAGAKITKEEQAFVDSKKQELKDKGIEIVYHDNKVWNTSENLTANFNMVEKNDTLSKEEIEIVEKELKVRKKKVKKLMELKGISEAEAMEYLEDSIGIKTTVQPQLNKDGKMIQSAKVDVKTIFVEDVEAVLERSRKNPSNKAKQKKDRINAKYNELAALDKSTKQSDSGVTKQNGGVLSPEDKIVWGHPGLGKTTFKENNPNNVLDFDTDFKPQVAKALGLPKNKQNSKGLNEWRQNNSEEAFKSEMRKAWKKAVAESKKTGKILVVSDMMFLEENEADFDKVVTTSKEAFKERATKRGDNTKGLDSWKSNIDKTVSSVDSSKVINTDKYFSEIQPTQQTSEVSKPKLTQEQKDKRKEVVEKAAALAKRLNLDIRNINSIDDMIVGEMTTVENVASAINIVEGLTIKQEEEVIKWIFSKYANAENSSEAVKFDIAGDLTLKIEELKNSLAELSEFEDNAVIQSLQGTLESALDQTETTLENVDKLIFEASTRSQEQKFILDEYETDDNVVSEKDFSKTSSETKPIDKVGTKIKRVFAQVSNGKTGFLGLENYDSFKQMYDTVLLHLSSNNNLNSNFNEMMALLENIKDSTPWMKPLIKALKESDEQTKTQFVYNTYKQKINAKFATLSFNDGGEVVSNIYDSNSNEAKRSVVNKWTENFKRSPVNKEGLIDKNVLQNLKDTWIKWANNGGVENQTNEEYQDWLGKFGIELSDSTWKALRNAELNVSESGGRLRKVESFQELFGGLTGTDKSSRSGYLFSNLMKYTMLKLETKESVEFYENTTNHPFKDMSTILGQLAELESKYNPVYGSTSRYVAGKSLTEVEIPTYFYEQIKKLKRSALSENKKYLEDLGKISFSKDSYLLELLKTDTVFANQFGHSVVEIMALKELYKKSPMFAGIDELSSFDYMFTQRAMFQNRNQGQARTLDGMPFDIRMAHLNTLTNSDKGRMMLLKTGVFDFYKESEKAFENKEGGGIGFKKPLQDLLYSQLVMPELRRMATYIDKNFDSNIEGYDKGAVRFNTLPILNTILNSDGLSIKEFLDSNDMPVTEILAAVQESFGSEINRVLEENIINEAQANVKKLSPFLEDGIDKFNNAEYLKYREGTLESNILVSELDFTINSMITNMNYMSLVAGDPALYFKNPKVEANTKDLSIETKISEVLAINLGKRMASMIAPGSSLANSNDNEYIQIFLEDVIGSADNLIDIIEMHYRNGEIDTTHENGKTYREMATEARETQEYDKILKNKFSSIADFIGIETTDAQEYTTLKEHLYVMLGQGNISQDKHDAIKVKLKDGKDLTKEELDLVLQPIKPVVTGTILDSRQDVNRAMYIKSSSFPLIPQLTRGRELDDLRVQMEKVEAAEGLTVRASYQTANKVGGLTGENTVKSFNQAIMPNNYLKLPRINFRIQQDVPFKSDKIQDDTVSMGTQIFKLLMGDGIMEMDNFMFEGASYTGKELKAKFHTIFSAMVGLKRNKFLKSIGLDETMKSLDENVTAEKVRELLIKEAKSRGFSKQDLKILDLVEDSNGKKIFKLPLWLTGNSNKYESMLNALINNKIFKQKIPGNKFVTASPAGFALKEGVNNVENSSRIVHLGDYKGGTLKSTRLADGTMTKAQILVPSKFKLGGKLIDLFEEFDGKDGVYLHKVNGIVKIKEGMIDPKLLDQFLFRIPTSSHGLGSSVEVVGFLPPESGDMIITPAGFIAQMGQDFDVDSLTAYQYHHIVMENGAIKELTEDNRDAYINEKKEVLESLVVMFRKKEVDTDSEKGDTYLETISKLTDAIDGLGDLTAYRTVEQFENKIEELKLEVEKDFEAKLLENQFVEIHNAVYSNPQAQQQINKALSMAYAEKQAEDIQALTAAESNTFNILSPQYQMYKMNAGSTGSVGIGIYAKGVTLHSSIQQAVSEGNYIGLGTEEAGKDPIKKSITIGKLKSTGALGRLKAINQNPTFASITRRISTILDERANTATDNEKAQILGRTGLNNKEAIAVDSLLSLLGFDSEYNILSKEEYKKEEPFHRELEIDGKMTYFTEHSIPYMLHSQPIIKEYFDLINEKKSIVTEGFTADASKAAVVELLEKYADADVIIAGGKLRRVYMDVDGKERSKSIQNNEQFTAERLQNQIKLGKKSTPNFQLQILALYTDLMKDAKNLQKLDQHTDLNNLGKSMWESTTKAKEFREYFMNPKENGLIGSTHLVGEVNYISELENTENESNRFVDKNDFITQTVNEFFPGYINSKNLMGLRLAMTADNILSVNDMLSAEELIVIGKNTEKAAVEAEGLTMKGYTFENKEDKIYAINSMLINILDGRALQQNDAEVKKGVTKVFKENSKLSEVGTEEQYSTYLNTIFPESQVKDIVYHGTNLEFEEFDTTKRREFSDFEGSKAGIFVSNVAENVKHWGKNTMSMLVNSKSPIPVSFEDFKDGLFPKEADLIYPTMNTAKPKSVSTVLSMETDLAILKSEQVYVLGSKKDVDGFKEFVKTDTSSATTSQTSIIDLGENIGIIPKTNQGVMVATALSLSEHSFTNLFPAKNDYINAIIKTIFDFGNINEENSFAVIKAKEEIFQEIKKYLTTNEMLGIFNKSSKEVREDLFMDNLEKDHVSLSSYTGGLFTNKEKEFKEGVNKVKNNVFLNYLKYEFGEGGKPSLISFNNQESFEANQESIYASLKQLIAEDYPLPNKNGEPFSTRKLAQELIAYSYASGGIVQGALEFHKFLPIEYLDDMAYESPKGHRPSISKQLRKYHNIDKGRMLEDFIKQYFQNNPASVKQVKMTKYTLKNGDVYYKPGEKTTKRYLTSKVGTKSKLKKDKWKLYERVGDTFNYKEIEILGEKGMAEYEFQNSNATSLIGKKTVPEVSSNSMELKTIEDEKLGTIPESGSKVASFLNAIKNGEYGNYSNMQEIAKYFMEFVGENQIFTYKDMNARGRVYQDNSMALNPTLIKTNEELATTFMHETAHTLTSPYVNQHLDEFGELVKNAPRELQGLQNVLEDYRVKLKATYGKDYTDFLEKLKTYQKELTQNLPSTVSFNPLETDVFYPSTNLKELIATSLGNNKIFKEVAGKMTYLESDNSIIQKIAQFITDLVKRISITEGIPENSIALQALKLSFSVVETSYKQEQEAKKPVEKNPNVSKAEMEKAYQEYIDQMNKEQQNFNDRGSNHLLPLLELTSNLCK